MNKLVKVFYDEEFVGTAFIEGVKYRKGDYGWFTVLDLLLTTGERIDGCGYSVYPYTLLLDYMELNNDKETK